jgi:glucose-6-phosphate isomerase
MTNEIQYDPSAAHKLLKTSHLKEVESDILSARKEIIQDVELLKLEQEIPPEKEPLDAGFINLPALLLDECKRDRSSSLTCRIESTASQLREEIDRLVVLGIGGSYMGARALFEALRHPFHNELPREERQAIPRISFAGNNLDNDVTCGLLELLNFTCRDNNDVRQRWGITVISKSGGTLETAVAFRIFRDALESFYGPDSEESRRLIVPITGDKGKLRDLATAAGYRYIFPILNGVGGRFSVFTSVGLFPAAMLGLNLPRLLEGAADMTERFFREPMGNNPVLDYTATCLLMEEELGIKIRVLSTWGSRLEALGLWYDQLLSESLGKKEQGATPLTVVNTRDLHSRGQQHQEGTRDKLITNVIVESASTKPLRVPHAADDSDQLNQLSEKTIPELLTAAIEGTNRAYSNEERPTADIVLPLLDEYTLGQLMQMLMLATVVEGRLIRINPYGQPGVEAYKRNMAENLEII